MDVMVNYGAVLVCSIGAVVLGSLWYGPLFGKQWMRLSNIHKPEVITDTIKRSMMRSYGITFIASLAMIYVLAHVLGYASAYTHMGGVDAGLSAGFWSWLGFVVPTNLNPVLWEGKPWKLWFINVGYYLVLLLGAGVVLAVW